VPPWCPGALAPVTLSPHFSRGFKHQATDFDSIELAILSILHSLTSLL